MDKKIKYKIIRGGVKEFALFEENLPPKGENVHINMKSNFAFDFNASVLNCSMSCTFVNEGQSYGKITNFISFGFHLDTIKMFAVEGGIRIPQDVARHCASVTFGALRGIIMDKAQETRVNLPILPLTDFAEIITKDIEIYMD